MNQCEPRPNPALIAHYQLLFTYPLIARFGGFLGRQSDGHPGPKALWQGMQRVREFALALEAGKAV